ncbi:MAG: CHASE2 domain-containing protein, partial [Novosphingobium sp.]
MRFWAKSDKKEKRGASPRRMFIWASLLTAIAGFVFLFEPLEDIYRGGRNVLRMHPADQSVVVVGIDNKTIERLGGTSFSRNNDAKLVNALFSLGARRVYFDRAFADPRDPEGDLAFEQALGRNRGRVFLGAFVSFDPISGVNEAVLPFADLRNSAEMRALGSEIKPFALSSELYYSMVINGTDIRSVSSDIAQVKGPANVPFRPDWSIDVKTIPTIGYVDVLDGKVNASAIAGKDLIVAQTTVQGKDITQVVGQGWFPAVYGHVVATQTLRNGTPRNVGWIPAWLVAAAMAVMMLKAQSRKTLVFVWAGALAAAIAVPFILDINLITADFVPAYLLFGIVAYRVGAQRSLARASRRNAGTLMPNLSALREEPAAGSRPIIAMRIRNYAAVCASFAEAIDDELFIELARRLSLPGGSSTFYQAEDVLYWLGPALPKTELEDHLEGLARLIESQFVIQNRKIDIHVAFGVDNDQARSVVSRIGRALLAADTAAARHQLMAFSTWDDDEDSAWELSLMSELDAAIDAGDIWVAYQPQFDLKTNAISGVEALVRWQ